MKLNPKHEQIKTQIVNLHILEFKMILIHPCTQKTRKVYIYMIDSYIFIYLYLSLCLNARYRNICD